MKVKTKVVEGLVDDSTFINNVKVVGHYLEAKAEDDAHTIIYTKTPNIEKELPKTGIDD